MEASVENQIGEARDVPIEEALAEDGNNVDQAEESTRPRPGAKSEAESKKEEMEEDLEALAPKTGAKEWSFGTGDDRRIYIQRELSIIGKSQWFAEIGEMIDKAFSSESFSINSLLDMPAPRNTGQIGLQDFRDADTFVHAVGKLLVYAPEFLERSVCIWLNVPDYEWDYVRILMRQSPSEGGMSDDQFEEIFATFIDQNYKAIDDFFRQRFARLRKRLEARATEANS